MNVFNCMVNGKLLFLSNFDQMYCGTKQLGSAPKIHADRLTILGS